MARRAPLVVPSELERDGMTFLHFRSVEKAAGEKKEAARDRIKGWLTLKNANGQFVNGEEDGEGNRVLPATINGQKIVAQRKSPAPYIDMDAAEKLLRELDPTGVLYDKVFKRTVERVFHEDELFVLNQMGVVSDEALDALEVQGEPSYSLVVVDE